MSVGWRRLVALAALVAQVSMVGGCRSAQPSPPPSTPAEQQTDPVEVVRAYYGELAARRFAGANAYLAPETQAAMAATDEPPDNLRTLKHLTVGGPSFIDAERLPGMPLGLRLSDYDQFASVVVEYDATFRRVITDRNGRVTRFLYLGRTREGQRWRILTIGSGP